MYLRKEQIPKNEYDEIVLQPIRILQLGVNLSIVDY